MEKEEGGAFFSFETFLLVLSVCFGVILKLRGWLFQKGIFKTSKLPCKVISVGNLAVGGTGKTPMTIYVAGLLQRLGYRPVVISRGYRGRAERSGGVVSDGEALLMTADMAGDEPVMMAESMKQIPVLVGQNRHDIGQLAMQKFSPDVIIFDDAFQHRKLARDIDLVLLDTHRPFGNGHLLPRGALREPASALARGSAFVMTRFDEPSHQRWDHHPWEHGEAFMTGKPVFMARHTPYVWQHAVRDSSPVSAAYPDRERLQDDRLQNYRVYAFSGIVRNSDFRAAVKGFGCRIAGYAEFPDHHTYTQGELDRIFRSAEEAGAEALVTTDKDYARIVHRFSWPLNLLVVGIKITFVPDDDSFDHFIERRLSRLP